MWGSVGMTYNLDMVKERLPDADLNDLGVLLNPETAAKLADCGISILDSPTDIGFMVLSYLGIDPNTAGPAEYAKMVEAFKPIREYIATFDNANYSDHPAERRAVRRQQLVGRLWRGQDPRRPRRGSRSNLDYFVPKTGAPAWFDLWAIPADAPNVAERA